MTQSLFDIVDELEAIDRMLEESGGELTPEIEAHLSEMEGDFTTKVENIGKYLRNLSDLADSGKAEKARLTELVRVRTAKHDRLKGYLKKMLVRSGKLKVETPTGRFSVVKNSAVSIEWKGKAEDIPEGFRVMTYKLDGTAAGAYYKKHRELPSGFSVDRGNHLRIK